MQGSYLAKRPLLDDDTERSMLIEGTKNMNAWSGIIRCGFGAVPAHYICTHLCVQALYTHNTIMGAWFLYGLSRQSMLALELKCDCATIYNVRLCFLRRHGFLPFFRKRVYTHGTYVGNEHIYLVPAFSDNLVPTRLDI